MNLAYVPATTAGRRTTSFGPAATVDALSTPAVQVAVRYAVRSVFLSGATYRGASSLYAGAQVGPPPNITYGPLVSFDTYVEVPLGQSAKPLSLLWYTPIWPDPADEQPAVGPVNGIWVPPMADPLDGYSR